MSSAQDGAAKEAGSVQAGQGFARTLGLLGTLLAVTLGAQLPAHWTPPWLAPQRDTYAEIWPQSWNFFASEADSATVSADRLGAGGRLSAPALAPQMSAANLWGLGRTSTLQFDELHILAAKIPAKDWIACADARLASCLAKAPVVPMQNEFAPGIVCGDLVFIKTRPAVAPRSTSIAVVRVACP